MQRSITRSTVGSRSLTSKVGNVGVASLLLRCINSTRERASNAFLPVNNS